ncbi:probable serine/threonine-protein kinase nek3 [Teleopsis dalmanni]|uniref:probable serine/threonine-protein kinase nek3 n=1 Tax=Teleopsis dalmanni TaxID=139649 RepID=UPI0018CC7C2E|nr:probable serine/threonine-protein kinase nek3 [Teleopsis dalmanni]
MLHSTLADSGTPARALAKRTGATQFEEEIYETSPDSNEHKHHLKKRSSDEDVDYEVYQGVVGRPGIDFPIYPRIPKTSFSCRSFGNGYFADMETDCQVFHICEEGRKISFLCPNGTIFQQSELICDWWFKVNCLGSSGFYAESSEILNKQKVQRLRPSVPVQGFNIVGGGLNIKPNIGNSVGLARPRNKSERRIDSNEEPSVETIDFDDISAEKPKVLTNIDNNNNEHEAQETAESGSLIGANRRNNFNYDKGNTDPSTNKIKQNSRANTTPNNSKRSNNERGAQTKNNWNPPNGEPSERARNGQRGKQRYREDKTPITASVELNGSGEKTTVLRVQKPLQVVPFDISGRSNGKSSISAEPADQTDYYQTQSTRTIEKSKSTTPSHSIGTYSTARRLDSTKTTAFYTPTVPSVSKPKTTEGKSYYVKGKGGVNNPATTPNTNRFNSATGTSLVLESSTTRKPTTFVAETESTISTTFKPIVIGMRHNYDTPAEIQRFSLQSGNLLASQKDKKNFEFTTTTAAPTGPTYLPKSAASPTGNDDAGGDSVLFAPIPAVGDTISRNVNEMIKTINLIKDEFDDVSQNKYQGEVRAGLEIPPSSGPDALFSLAKYFAAEQNGSSANALPADVKESKTKALGNVNVGSARSATGLKPSDTTALLTTPATDKVNVKSDDIAAGLLREKTVTQYSNLFGLKDAKGKQQEDTEVSKTETTTSSHSQFDNTKTSLFPQIGSTDATIRQLAEKADSRKIAQVFSNALNTYLEDPKTFRAQLASVRPTEPSAHKPNFEIVTVTDPSLFKSGTGASYLPTKPTPAIESTTKRGNIAAEINTNFYYSTRFADFTSTTEIQDATTYKPRTAGSTHKHSLQFSGELLPPGADSAEGDADEFLQREQTQSFVKSRNNLNLSSQETKHKGDKHNAFKPTEHPWQQVSQAEFLDPLTINDGLMKGAKTTTSSPFTYLPKETTTQFSTTSEGKLQVLSSSSHRFNGQRNSIQQGNVDSAKHSNTVQHSTTTDSWQEIFNNYDIPRETLPSSSGLQRIANKLFGGLNESEALHLKNVMQQAEHNRQVLSLLLLLIQTCDDHNGKALERSRKQLLSALIDMDGKIKYNKNQNGSYKVLSSAVSGTTTRVPVTTYRRGSDDIFTQTTTYSPTSTTTDLSTTTISSTSSSSSLEETTKFEIRVEDPEEEYTTPSSGTVNRNSTSDKRALELLKSLYSLASKFTSRR